MDRTRLDRRPELGAIAIAIGTWALAAWLTTRSSLFDRDEPRFARAALEMLASHNWLYPTFEGELRADKPIFAYWLMASAMKLFGATAWAARAASPIALAATGYVVHRIGRELFDARTGRTAQLMFVLSPLALVEGTISTTDALLVLFTTIATWRGMQLLSQPARVRDVLLLSCALGLGLLTKGPIALLPVAAWITTRWIARRSIRAPIHGRMGSHGIATAIACAIFLAWAIPANVATGGDFARLGIGHHVVDRATQPMEGHGGGFLISLPFYLPVIVLGLFPWTPFLLGGAATLWSPQSLPPWPRAVLLGWILPCVAILSLVATKLPHYILPAWPGLALAMAVHLKRATRGELQPSERAWLTRGAWLHAAVMVAVAVACWLAPARLGIPEARNALLVATFVWVGTGAIALALGAHHRWWQAAGTLAAGTVAAWIWVGAAVIGQLEQTKPGERTARAIAAQVEPSVPIATFRYHEPSLDFYVGTRRMTRLPDFDAVRAWMNGGAPRVLVLPESELDGALSSAPSGSWREIARERGFDRSKGRALELIVLAH